MIAATHIRIAIANTADWSGFYFNGWLSAEGEPETVQEAKEIELRESGRLAIVEQFEADPAWLAECGSYPEHLSAVKRA